MDELIDLLNCLRHISTSAGKLVLYVKSGEQCSTAVFLLIYKKNGANDFYFKINIVDLVLF